MIFAWGQVSYKLLNVTLSAKLKGSSSPYAYITVFHYSTMQSRQMWLAPWCFFAPWFFLLDGVIDASSTPLIIILWALWLEIHYTLLLSYMLPPVLCCLQYFTLHFTLQLRLAQWCDFLLHITFCSMVWVLPPVYFLAFSTLHFFAPWCDCCLQCTLLP